MTGPDPAIINGFVCCASNASALTFLLLLLKPAQNLSKTAKPIFFLVNSCKGKWPSNQAPAIKERKSVLNFAIRWGFPSPATNFIRQNIVRSAKPAAAVRSATDAAIAASAKREAPSSRQRIYSYVNSLYPAPFLSQRPQHQASSSPAASNWLFSFPSSSSGNILGIKRRANFPFPLRFT